MYQDARHLITRLEIGNNMKPSIIRESNPDLQFCSSEQLLHCEVDRNIKTSCALQKKSFSNSICPSHAYKTIIVSGILQRFLKKTSTRIVKTAHSNYTRKSTKLHNPISITMTSQRPLLSFKTSINNVTLNLG